MSDKPTEIQVQHVRKSFGEHDVLKDIDLAVHPGEILAIVGGSGSGKSTLFKLIIGLLRPDAGKVLLVDHESPDAPLTDLAMLDENQLERIRRHIGVVFQQNALYSGPVHDNVTLALQEVQGQTETQANDAARSAIEAVGLNADEVWNQQREELSGGMAKRIAIARALAMDPILMLYDEPTTGLDPEGAGRIYELIGRTHEKPAANNVPRTTLIITHDKELLGALQPRVALLHDGQIAFDGDFKEFEQSDSPIIKPYLEQMPALHLRRRIGGKKISHRWGTD